MPKRRLILAAIVAIAAVLLFATPVLASAQFPDVPSTYPYSSAINDLAARSVIGGYANGNYGPDDLVTRQQFAKMIVKTLGLPVTGSEVCPFVDVSADATGTDAFYPAKYVAVCAMNNITKGIDATHFSPGANIRRSQVISMIVRAADNLAPGILRVPDATWTGVLAYDDPTHGANIKKAEFNNLLAWIVGPDGTLKTWNADGYATRGEIAELLHNLRLAKLPALEAGALLRVIKANGSAIQFTLAQLQALPSGSITVDGKTEDGALVSALMEAAGVKHFDRIMLTGSKGPVTVNVLTTAQVDNQCILDFTNQNTVKVATPAIDKADWAKDIFVVEVF
jgi:hypothetical protein